MDGDESMRTIQESPRSNLSLILRDALRAFGVMAGFVAFGLMWAVIETTAADLAGNGGLSAAPLASSKLVRPAPSAYSTSDTSLEESHRERSEPHRIDAEGARAGGSGL